MIFLFSPKDERISPLCLGHLYLEEAPGRRSMRSGCLRSPLNPPLKAFLVLFFSPLFAPVLPNKGVVFLFLTFLVCLQLGSAHCCAITEQSNQRWTQQALSVQGTLLGHDEQLIRSLLDVARDCRSKPAGHKPFHVDRHSGRSHSPPQSAALLQPTNSKGTHLRSPVFCQRPEQVFPSTVSSALLAVISLLCH